MLPGLFIDPEPEDYPKECQHRSDGENPAPAVTRGDDGDEDGRDGRTDGTTDAVKPNGNAALRSGEPFGYGLGRCGPAAGFPKAQHEADGIERA